MFTTVDNTQKYIYRLVNKSSLDKSDERNAVNNNIFLNPIRLLQHK